MKKENKVFLVLILLAAFLLIVFLLVFQNKQNDEQALRNVNIEFQHNPVDVDLASPIEEISPDSLLQSLQLINN
jgi:hypothetical protein